jgi:hypothetical protein
MYRVDKVTMSAKCTENGSCSQLGDRPGGASRTVSGLVLILRVRRCAMAHPIHAGGGRGAVVARLAQYAAIGVAGDLLVRGARRLTPTLGPTVHALGVGCLTQGIRLGRAVERATEGARLAGGDLLAEAREQLREEPGTSAGVGPNGHER